MEKKIKILYIIGENINIELKEVLTTTNVPLDYRLIFAYEAMEIVKNNKNWDLVFIDFNQGEGTPNGIELAKELNQLNKHLYIVILPSAALYANSKLYFETAKLFFKLPPTGKEQIEDILTAVNTIGEKQCFVYKGNYSLNSFAKKLRTVRKYRHIKKQTSCCSETGISRQTWSMWERNLRLPSLQQLADICNFFKVTPEYFFCEEISLKNFLVDAE